MFCSKCGNPIDDHSAFCSKCGNKINVQEGVNQQQNPTIPSSNTTSPIEANSNTVSWSNPYPINEPLSQPVLHNHSNEDKRMILIGMGVGVGVLAILFLIILIFGKNSEKYYFDTNSNEPDNEVVTTSNASTKKGKYSTVIIYDNTYSGVKITNNRDALSLIEKDSVSQKVNCPSEIQKVEDEIINNYGITAVNLCEMDVQFARELGNVFKKIYEEYPSVRGYITNLTLVNAPMQNNYIAAFMPVFHFATSDSSSTYPWVIKTHILLNSAYFLNQERLSSSVSEGSNSGHFPKNTTIYSPVAHELGHYLSFLAMMKHYELNSILLIDSNTINPFYQLYTDFGTGDYSLSMITEAYENYKKDTPTPLSLDDWRGTISNYALAKDNSGNYIYDETIAESFHDVYLNGDNASEASKYIVAVLKDKLGSR